jgi:hypothetical protein
VFPFPRGHGNGFPCPPLSSIADVHRRADKSRLPCLAFTSTRIAQSGGVSTPRSAQHIASIHLRPTETGFSFFLLQQQPTCHCQQALRYRGIHIPVRESSPPARPGPPARYTTSTVQPRLLLWLPELLVLPSIRAALICPALAPWLDFIMPVLAFQSNKPG